MPATKPRQSSARSFRTPFLPIPNRDWPLVTTGQKTEVRWPLHAISNPTLTSLKALTPIPVVGYTKANPLTGGRRRDGLIVCDGGWVEPLGSISPASIEAEGFETVKEFRAYWRARYNDRFDRFKKVWCFKVRPYRPEEAPDFAEVLYRYLILEPFDEMRRGGQ